jgi:hypothetical protein
MRRAIIVLSVLIILLVPFINACDSGGAPQLVYWARLWAVAHGITDENGNPNYGAIARFAAGEAFGLGSTGDQEADAAIDCARVLDKIRRAEDAADIGWESLNSGQNIRADVLSHFDRAIDLRPEDWSYRNGRGIANLEDLDNADGAAVAGADFDTANAIARKSGQPEEYLRMLRHREQALARLVAFRDAQRAYPTKEVYLEQSRLYNELYTLTGENNYLLLKQQADADLREGHYRQRTPAG